MKPEKSAIPRQIFSLWAQGEDAAPPLVRLNFDRWRKLNPSFEVKILSQNDLETHLSGFPASKSLTLQSQSDLLRIRLLQEFGGVWTDASVFPVTPLEDWIDEATENNGFFAYSRPEKAVRLSSWFLAATKGNPILKEWNALISHYWSVSRVPISNERHLVFLDDPQTEMRPFDTASPRPYPYFWLHHLFAVLLETNPAIASLWDMRWQSSHKLPHNVQNAFLRADRKNSKLIRKWFRPLRLTYPNGTELADLFQTAEVQKLDWRATHYPLNWMASLTTNT